MTHSNLERLPVVGKTFNTAPPGRERVTDRNYRRDSMATKSNRERGQILIMTTLLALPIFGVLGLVTDLGYMHYVKMTAQSAAEAAAQSAMIDFHQNTGASAYSCGANVVCASSETNCPAGLTSPANSIQDGCMYAQAHGFAGAGAVTYQTGVSSAPPTAPGMGQAAYWV